MAENHTSRPSSIDEIDFIELLGLFKSKRRFLINCILAFLILGAVVAFTSRIEYTAASKLLPESGGGTLSMGGLGGLAGLAGFNLDDAQKTTLSPEIYPAIVNSLPFLIQVANEPILFNELGQDYSPYYYFDRVQSPSFGELILKYTIGLPGLIISNFSNDEDSPPRDLIENTLVLTKRERQLIDELAGRILLESDTKTGMITLTVEMPDPYAASQLAEKVTSLLMKRITQYKIEKAKINLEFVEERHKESKQDYEGILQNLAVYTDRNVNVVSSVAQIETQRLQNEVDVAFGVYKELATQLEQAKIKVKEQTPVLTVLEPAAVPVQKSSPKRLTILVSAFLLGFIAASVTIFARHILKLG